MLYRYLGSRSFLFLFLAQRNFNFQELNKLLEFDKKSAH